MATKRWTIRVEQKQPDGQTGVEGDGAADPSDAPPLSDVRTHTVELRHSFWTGRRSILLDGNPVPKADLKSYSIYGLLSDDLFLVDGQPVMVHVRTNGLVYRYDCSVNGVSVETDLPVKFAPQVLMARAGAGDKMPQWAWAFYPLAIVFGIVGVVLGLAAHSALVSLPVSSVRTPILSAVGTLFALRAMLRIAIVSKQPGLETERKVNLCLKAVALGGIYAAVVSLIVSVVVTVLAF